MCFSIKTNNLSHDLINPPLSIPNEPESLTTETCTSILLLLSSGELKNGASVDAINRWPFKENYTTNKMPFFSSKTKMKTQIYRKVIRTYGHCLE